MAYRLYVELKDGNIIDKRYEHEEYATNLYGLALFKKLAKRASITDTMTGEILFEYGES